MTGPGTHATGTGATRTARRRGRPAFPRELVLAAADELFARTDAPQTVSMDDIARAAGVGKGTLFRAFGNRVNLINAVFDARVAAIREAVDTGEAPLGPAAPPVERAIAILGRLLLVFKLENRYLTRAMEEGGSEVFRLGYYQWIHGLLTSLVTAAGEPDPDYAGYAAHVLLGSLRTDLNDELTGPGGASAEDILRAQARLVRRVLGDGH